MEDLQHKRKCVFEEFTGFVQVYPVELFISLMEASQEDSENLCARALDHICSDQSTPAGYWKTRNESKITHWEVMKNALLQEFGIKYPYGVEHQLEFIKSLRKTHSESFKAFHNRVDWVLENVIGTEVEKKLWTKLLFLQGLGESDVKIAIQMLMLLNTIPP